MADKEVAIKINVDADGGAKSLSELKKEFKETQKTLEGLTIGTKEYVNTLQRLGGIKDDIGDLNDTIKTFNPEGKIQAFGNVMGGVASGIQGAVGAMALFGVESEETQKMLLKVQAASAFADGVKGVVGMGDAFKNLQLVLGKTALGQKLVTAGQWLWNAAMSANPIGLIIAGIAALVGAFALLSVSSEDAAVDQARLNELEKEAAEKLDKHVAAIEKKNAILNKATDFEIQLLKAKGATEEELLEAEKKRDETRRLQLMFIKGFRDMSAAESAELLALTQKQTLASAKIIGDAKKEEVANKKKYAEEQKKIDDKELEESKARAAEARKDLEELHNVRKGFAQLEEQDRLEKQAKADEDVEAETQKILSRLASRKELIEFQNAQTYAGQLENLQIQMDAELKLVEDDEAAKFLIREKYAEKERQLRLTQATAALEIAQKSNEAMQGLADLYFSIKMANVKKGSAEEEKAARQQFKVNKGLALTGAILSTAMAAIKSLSQAPLAIGPVPSPIGIASLAATVLTGAASIAKIAATQYTSTSTGGGGGGAMASLGSASGGVALEPPSSGSTQLNADGTIKSAMGNSQPTIKAVVVETDITTSQKRVNTIEERASL